MRSGLMKSIPVFFALVLTGNIVANPLPADCTDGASLASMEGSSCSVGGTTFSNFAYKVTGSGANLAPDDSDVHIHFVNTLLNPQLMFTADPTWNLDGPDDGQFNNSYNAFIDFDILAPENFVVSGIGLSATGFDILGSAGKVVETVLAGVNTLNLQVSGFPETTTTLSDSLSFDGALQIHVTKKIQLSNGNGQGNGFDSITQGFTLTDPPAAVPEPTSMLLIGSGLIAVGLVRRVFAR